MGKIEQQIDEIESFLDGCKAAAFSTNKVVVDKIQMEELLEELRRRVPNEIKQCQRLLSNKDSILAEAQEQAEDLIRQAQERTQQMLNTHDIVKQATAIADDIVIKAREDAKKIRENANEEATAVREGAIAYTDGLLQNIENALLHTLDATQTRFGGFVNTLNSSLNVVKANRAELQSPDQENYEAPAQELTADGLDMDGKATAGDEYDF